MRERYLGTYAVLRTRKVNNVRARPGLTRGYAKSVRYDVGERSLLARKIELRLEVACNMRKADTNLVI